MWHWNTPYLRSSGSIPATTHSLARKHLAAAAEQRHTARRHEEGRGGEEGRQRHKTAERCGVCASIPCSPAGVMPPARWPKRTREPEAARRGKLMRRNLKDWSEGERMRRAIRWSGRLIGRRRGNGAGRHFVPFGVIGCAMRRVVAGEGGEEVAARGGGRLWAVRPCCVPWCCLQRWSFLLKPRRCPPEPPCPPRNRREYRCLLLFTVVYCCLLMRLFPVAARTTARITAGYSWSIFVSSTTRYFYVLL